MMIADSHKNEEQDKEQDEDQAKKWTGKHVLIAVVLFFVAIIIVNLFMVGMGIMTFPGEDTQQSYRQGLEYNQTIEKRNQQIASGWSADIIVSGNNTLVLKITDAQGKTVKGLKVTGALKHLAETDRDFTLKFAQSATGTYIAPVDTALFGQQWLLVTKAQKSDGTSFDTRNKLWLKQAQ